MTDLFPTAIITASARTLIGPSLTFANYMSLPIPVVSDGVLFLAFLVGRGEAVNPELGYQIWPPKLITLFDIGSGQFQELRAVSPSFFAIEQAADQPIGKGLAPPEKQSASYLEKELKLFQSCDNLINTLVQGQPHEEALKQYDDQYIQMCEEPLLAYFRRTRLAQIG
ncbi:MAG: hypothetical protein ABW095_08755 [Candidatus Thiodiazotropha sp.]